MSTNAQPPAQTQAMTTQHDNKLAPKTVRQMLDDKKSEIERMLPASIGVERFTRVALMTIADERLKECTPLSLYMSVMQAASVGLVPDGFLGHAYIVPFYNGKKQVLEAKMMIGYRGLMELALRSEKVLGVRANIVYEGDHFDYEEGLVTKLVHRPCPVSRRTKSDAPGDGGYVMVGAYSVAKVKDVPAEESPFVFMYAEDILAIRGRSKNAFGRDGKLHGPWLTDPAAMWEKTVVRQLAKFLPLTPEAMKAVVEDEYTELGVTEQGAHIEVPRAPVAMPQRERQPATVEVDGRSYHMGVDPGTPGGDRTTTAAPAADDDGHGVAVDFEQPPEDAEADAEEPAAEHEAAPEPTVQKPDSAAAKAAPENIPGVTKGMPPKGDPNQPVKEGQVKLLRAKARGAGKDEAALKEHVQRTYGVEHLHELKNAHVNEILRWISGE